jgi:hypothetical protein
MRRETLGSRNAHCIRGFYCELAALAEKEGGVKKSHSLGEAKHLHAAKRTPHAAELGALQG